MGVNRHPRATKWTIGFALLAVTCLVTAGIVAERSFGRDYVAEVRSAGEPTTLRELFGPDPSDAENAAPAITSSLAAAKARFDSIRGWDLPGPWNEATQPGWEDVATPERIDEVRRALDELSPFFDDMRTALVRPRCRFASPGPTGTDAPETRVLQGVQRFLFSRAEVGAPADRLDACRTLLLLGDLNEAVTMIDAMVGAAIAGSAVRAVRRGVESSVIDPVEARKALDAALARP